MRGLYVTIGENQPDQHREGEKPYNAGCSVHLHRNFPGQAYTKPLREVAKLSSSLLTSVILARYLCQKAWYAQ
jgi:hypothetical protein